MVTDGRGQPGPERQGQGTLRFDLSAYAGKTITCACTTPATSACSGPAGARTTSSWPTAPTTLFTDDVENPPNGWTTNHFVTVPLTRTYPMYYLAEWRNNSGFDRGLEYPYTTIYYNADDQRVAGRSLPLHGARHGAVAAQRRPGFRLHPLRLPLRPAQLRTQARPARRGQPLLAARVGRHGYHRAHTCAWTLAASRATRPSPCSRPHRSPASRSDDAPATSWRPRPSRPSRRCRSSTTRWATTPDCATRAANPDNEGLYFWDAPASAGRAGQGRLHHRITWDDKTPATDLYGMTSATLSSAPVTRATTVSSTA